jgi:hypothetical protein
VTVSCTLFWWLALYASTSRFACFSSGALVHSVSVVPSSTPFGPAAAAAPPLGSPPPPPQAATASIAAATAPASTDRAQVFLMLRSSSSRKPLEICVGQPVLRQAGRSKTFSGR